MNPYRIALAKDMGVEAVVDPTSEDALDEIMDLTDGKGVAKSVECSSVETAPEFLIQAAALRGHIASPGWGGPINARDVNRKGLTVHGCWHWNHQRDARVMMGTIRGAESLLDKVITHTFAFSAKFSRRTRPGPATSAARSSCTHGRTDDLKTVAITGVERCELIDKPAPHAKDDFVVVKVLVGAPVHRVQRLC